MMSQDGREGLLKEIEQLRRRIAELEQGGTASPSWEQELFSVLVESAPEHAIFIVNSVGRIITWNAGAERLLGYQEDEILGRHFSCFYTEEDIAAGKPDHDLESARNCGKSEDEIWRIRKDGSRFIAQALMTPLRDPGGNLLGFARVVRDITERKLTEKALRESENRFRLFMDNSPTVNFITDGDGRFLYVDATWQRTFQSTIGEWIGRTKEEVWPADVAQRLREWEQTEFGAISPAETLVTRPVREMLLGPPIIRANTPAESLVTLPTRWGEAQWRFFRFKFTDAAGRHLIGGTGIEVTEQEQARAEVARLNAGLEQRVQERTAQLTVANEELNAFCYSVSHDLRAPLRAIAGFSQALMEDYGGTLDAMARDYLDRVQAEAQRMSQLIDDLLALSRVSRSEIHREPVDVSGLAGEITRGLRQRDPWRTVEFVIAPGLTAEVDRGLLRIALENLLENAWKFTSKRAEPRVEIGAECGPQGQPVWFVRDNGIGFDMAYAEHLFGAFQRLHVESEYPGTGIGLATVQRVIHRHGGRVWAQSAVGQGATFSFTLEPDLEAPRSEHRPRTEIILWRNNPVNERAILLVEDNRNDEALALRSLKKHKITNTIVVARDGSEAVDYLFANGPFASRDARDVPVLVLLDLKLPKLGGLEVLRRLRADERTHLVPVIIWTSSREEQDLKGGYTAGCNSYLQKPVDFDQFNEALRQVTSYWLKLNVPPPQA